MKRYSTRRNHPFAGYKKTHMDVPQVHVKALRAYLLTLAPPRTLTEIESKLQRKRELARQRVRLHRIKKV